MYLVSLLLEIWRKLNPVIFCIIWASTKGCCNKKKNKRTKEQKVVVQVSKEGIVQTAKRHVTCAASCAAGGADARASLHLGLSRPVGAGAESLGSSRSQSPQEIADAPPVLRALSWGHYEIEEWFGKNVAYPKNVLNLPQNVFNPLKIFPAHSPYLLKMLFETDSSSAENLRDLIEFT